MTKKVAMAFIKTNLIHQSFDTLSKHIGVFTEEEFEKLTDTRARIMTNLLQIGREVKKS